MERSAARYADWQACIRGVPVSEYGDPDRQFGYAYDERDGTGPGFMPALAVDRRAARATRTTCSWLPARRRLPQPRAAAGGHRRPARRAVGTRARAHAAGARAPGPPA